MKITRLLAIAAGTITLLCAASPAMAQVAEFRFGIAQHDIPIQGGVADGKETGADVQVQVIFDSPQFLHWALKPRPYLYGSLNTDGLTDFAAAGLNWKQDFGQRFYGDFSFGLAAHDGIVNVPADPGDPQRILWKNTRAILGSPVLFQSVFGLGYHINERWDMGVYFEHLSHGQILASGQNEGLNDVGVQFAYKF